MSAQVIPLPKSAGCWRYRMILGTLTRYWSAHNRAPQVWQRGSWQELEPQRVAHPAPALVQ
jgi:hypothetical protein